MRTSGNPRRFFPTTDRGTLITIIGLFVALLVLIVAIGTFTLLPANTITQTVSDQNSVQQKLLANSLARQVENLFNSIGSDLITLSATVEHDAASPEKFSAEFDAIGKTYGPELRDIALIQDDGADGKFMTVWESKANPGGGDTLPWKPDQRWIANILKGPHLQIVTRSRGGAEFAYLLAVPVKMGDLTNGVLTFEIDLNAFLSGAIESLSQVNNTDLNIKSMLSPSSQIWMFDRFGDNLYQFRDQPQFQGGVAQFLELNQLTLLNQYPTQDRVSVIVPIFLLNQDRTGTGTLTIIVSRSLEDAQQAVNNTLEALSLFGLGVIAFVVVIGLGGGRIFYVQSRQRQEAEQRRAAANILLSVSQAISSSLDLQIVLNRILSELAHVLPYDNATIMTAQSGPIHADSILYVAAEAGTLNPADSGEHFNIDDLLGIKAIINGQKPILINDTQHSEIWRSAPGSAIRGWLGVPLSHRGEVIGILNINSHHAGRFQPQDIETAIAFANNAAIAVENARLFAEHLQVEEELRELDQLKSAFVANMSHELRTPLNAILNFAEFIQVGLYGEPTEGQREALKNIVQSSEHLLSLINDLLDHSRIEAGQMDLFLEDVDVREVLNSAVATAQSLLHDSPVQLITALPPTLPTLRADRRRLKQIFLNLLSNAVKFTSEGHIKVAAQVQGENLLMSVEDTGIGIAEEDHEIIFEPFRQTREGAKRSASTGLGLPITRFLIEAHHGKLWLTSTPGLGSTFYVAIPITESVTEAQA
jgi:signal transduction histidine kinase